MRYVIACDPSIVARPDDPGARRIVELWQEDQLRLAMSRRCLAGTLRVLSRVGADERLLRRWSTLLTHPDRTAWFADPPGAGGLAGAFFALAALAGGRLLTLVDEVYHGRPGGVAVLGPSAWLAERAAAGKAPSG